MALERRRYLRHKVHSPAYASAGAGIGGVVLDANEHGAAIETVSRLTPHSFVDLRLDLLETRGSAVTPARVAWCDEAGRAGLEFLNLTGESRRQLQQWILLNALLATETARALVPAAPTATPAPEKEALPADPLQTAAERALSATAAHGAAIALFDGDVIVCRATAGDIAPPPGTKLNTTSGISGACVRSGRWLRCDDPRLDPHVDRESCQALGINSVLAVPIGQRGDILGILEVFSRQTYAFGGTHCSALQQLAENIAQSLRPSAAKAASVSPPQPETAAPAPPLPTFPPPQVAESPPETSAGPPAPSADRSARASVEATAAEPNSNPAIELASGVRQRVLLIALLAAFVLAGIWFLLDKGAGGAKDVDAAEAPPAASQNPPQLNSPAAPAPGSQSSDLSESLLDLRRRAEARDAEAEFELGARYASGDDVRQDYTEAVKWFARAAEGGQVLAAATLGAYYWAGRGVPQDDVSAFMWSSIAKDGGDEASKYRLAILRARMTGADVAEGERRAAAWQQSHSRPALMRRTTE